ncbi:MAG: IS66 family insertion sequence element accessory protein TnpB [Bacteroidota bacterium]|jgi:transposase
MLHLTSAVRYYLYRHPADMRKGASSLSGLVRNEMHHDPLKGAVFIFISRRGDQIKLLHWEGDGFALYSKKLEQGRYEWPRILTDASSITLTCEELHLMLRGIVLTSVRRHTRYVHKFVHENTTPVYAQK